MRLYTLDDEVRVALSRRVRDWTKAGLLASSQAAALNADLVTDLRRVGLVLRLGLALFTVIAGTAGIGLVFLGINMNSEVAISIACILVGIGVLLGATMFARTFKWYRHGVEEALAVGSVALVGGGVAILGFKIFSSGLESTAVCAATALVSAGFLFVFRRFGFQYAAVGAMCAAALLPMPFTDLGPETKRLFAALVCAGTGVWASGWGRRASDDVTRDDAAVVRAAAIAGTYLALNIYILPEPFGRYAGGWFRWSSWLLTWLLPLAAGRLAVVDRDPMLLRVAMAAGLATLLTNKSYLGWARQPWDPMLLGVLLVGSALLLRRWLSAGEAAERNGFTARQLVESEAATIQLVSLASVAMQPGPTRHSDGATDTSFSGGRSGGGGAGSAF